MNSGVRNERGMALIITLMVVAILMIIVTEFTFSTRIDSHMVRHGLSGLQASLLARSGINIGEAFLLHDNDPQIDAFTEEWCPSPGPRGESCLIDETNSGIVIPENMGLRIQIFDEGAKFSVNLTKPQNIAAYNAYLAWARNQDPNNITPFQQRLQLLAEMVQGAGAPPESIEALESYWLQLYAELVAQLGGPQAVGAAVATPGQAPAPAQRLAPGQQQYTVPDFPSLDDVGIIPGFTPRVLRNIRPFVTAYDGRGSRFQRIGMPAPININTAPRRLLQFLLLDEATVESIVTARMEAPLRDANLVQQAAAQTAQDPARKNIQTLFASPTSSLFLIRASAIINPDPMTGRGGIGRTASVIVRRDPKPGVGPNSPPGVSRWVLTRIQWQKEGGAALFRDAPDVLEAEGSPSEVF